MSRLSVFWPDEVGSAATRSDEPMIIPFPGRSIAFDSNREPMDVLTRARLLFSNRRCHGCGYPVVEPVELADAHVNRTGLTIPGTATLIGFRCCGCQKEWPI